MCLYSSAQIEPYKTLLPELDVDVPDETEETDVVEKGKVQAEHTYLQATFAKSVQPSTTRFFSTCVAFLNLANSDIQHHRLASNT